MPPWQSAASVLERWIATSWGGRYSSPHNAVSGQTERTARSLSCRLQWGTCCEVEHSGAGRNQLGTIYLNFVASMRVKEPKWSRQRCQQQELCQSHEL
jgi:hypothetical protein